MLINRDNIDPAGERSDAELNDALSLIHSNPRASSSLRDKFRLEANVMAEGSNFSAGEKQLREIALLDFEWILTSSRAYTGSGPKVQSAIAR